MVVVLPIIIAFLVFAIVEKLYGTQHIKPVQRALAIAGGLYLIYFLITQWWWFVIISLAAYRGMAWFINNELKSVVTVVGGLVLLAVGLNAERWFIKSGYGNLWQFVSLGIVLAVPAIAMFVFGF